MKFFRKNKYTIIAIFVLIIFVLVLAKFKNIFVPDDGKAVYGGRLTELKDKEIKAVDLNKITDKIKENEQVLEASSKIHGKIINLLIEVKDDLSVASAKEIASNTIGMFENGELSIYSLQVYVSKQDSKLNNFPIIGYKGVSSTTLSFTKDREIQGE